MPNWPMASPTHHIVSISGPPLSGKTTLFQGLSQRFPGLSATVADIPRQTLETIGAGVWERDLVAFQHYIGFAQLLAEDTGERSPGIVLMDKSLIDATAYWDVLIGGPGPVWAADVLKRQYALVIMCNHEEIGAPPDRLQSQHMQLRAQLAIAIERIARSCETPILHVSGDQSTRLARAAEALSSLVHTNNQ